MSNAVERSKALFNNRFLCGESVLQAIAEHLNIQSELIPRIATGFCSGMARTCGQCGAVSGAIMALSLVSGRKTSTESTDTIYDQTQRFLSRFNERHQSINCQGLIGVDLGTEEGQKQFKTENKFPLCESIVGNATQIAISIIEADAE